MRTHSVVSHQDWLTARREILNKEKQFTALRDELSAARRDLPWERVAKDYVFDGPQGRLRLADIFAGKSQLIVYHFMFAPDSQAGCKSCSFWADHFNGMLPHLAARDVSLVAISRAPIDKLQAFAKRLDWKFPWYSSGDRDFNYDYHVSFTDEQLARGKIDYNYEASDEGNPDLPGISVFYKDEQGKIFHTYSCYARGIDMLNGTYNYLDLVPKGRDEDGLPGTMSWVRFHDKYGS